MGAKGRGIIRSPAYEAYRSMRQRCMNPNNPSYPNYGGRGISICEAWSIYEGFLADMGERPADGLSLDRIDNNGNYEPSNCRWATRKEQQNNRRTNHLIEWEGELLTPSQLVEKTGSKVPSLLLTSRMNLGWDVKRALTLPSRPSRPRTKREVAHDIS